MKIEIIVSKMFHTNMYIIYDEASLEALIIDPGEMSKRMAQTLKTNFLKPVGIILTHHHNDHVRAVKKLRKIYDCPVYIHSNDEKRLKAQTCHRLTFFLRKQPHTFQLLNEGDIISAGEVTLKVIHTPGHTEGSICLELLGENIVFTGDTIFADGIGRTEFRGGDQAAMFMSLIEKVNKWPDDVIIFPGHGKVASMAEVRAFNSLFCSIIALVKNQSKDKKGDNYARTTRSI